MAKQLSLPERYVIERMLHQDYSFASIGRNLDRSASTIAREVLHYRCFTSRSPIMGENDFINKMCIRDSMYGLSLLLENEGLCHQGWYAGNLSED